MIANGNYLAFGVGLFTIAAMLAWERLRPAALREIPGALVAVVLATAAAALLDMPIARIPLPASFAGAIGLMRPAQLAELGSPALLAAAASLALIASIESLLFAAAVDRMLPRRKTDYSQELIAQGFGNMACGLAGALPMTGVIVRSAANVRAGARTRMSAVLHGVWLLALVTLAPALLRLVPTASLAGLLVVVGARLVNIHHLRALVHDGARTISVYATTLGVILCTNLLTGVLAGLALYIAFRSLPALVRRTV